MDEFPNTNGYSISWTQPYTVSMNPFYNTQHQSVHDEMIRILAVDHIVAHMTEYPEALAMIEEARHDR